MIYNKICLMIPTYGRAKTLLPNCVSTAEKTSHVICFSFCVNKKDTDTIEFIQNRKWKFKYEIIYEDLPTPHLAKFYNMLYAQSEWREDKACVISMIGDDMEFLTQTWDLKLLSLINHYHGIGVFWGNDDFIARERLCVNLFVTRDFVEATEHPFMCELFEAEMIDYLWHKVGKYTRTLHFDPDIHIKHNHSSKNPDSTYNRLQPYRNAAWIDGKIKAKEIASVIAEILIRKKMVGDSIC